MPWRLIGEAVTVDATDGQVRVCHAGREVAVHVRLLGAGAPRLDRGTWPASSALSYGRGRRRRHAATAGRAAAAAGGVRDAGRRWLVMTTTIRS